MDKNTRRFTKGLMIGTIMVVFIWIIIIFLIKKIFLN